MNIADKINKLRQEKNAVILAHNYVQPEVQQISDYSGDSLGLSRKAADTQADIILFCGVHFMAETASILSPQKKVLIPDPSAGCPMADMVTASQLEDFQKQHPNSLTVTYVNSSAEVKALSDYCCTSGNAVELVSNLPEDKEILFVPDRNLGAYVREQTGRKIITWDGCCPPHEDMTSEIIKDRKQQYPEAVVMAHPECPEDTRELADKLLSTAQMIQYASESTAAQFIVATEPGIIYALSEKCPDKEFIQASPRICFDMKKITLPAVLRSLENEQFEVSVPESTASKARKALERMLSVLPAASKNTAQR
ncbi:Quinolinate synthase A [Sedimentisphaera cyanobacteriorum]|uniref:Quinolinate synthase n=1 Tax=Sedimentisphaera cyanobacteriorum TaxID=1940790 RepID=A0A1Q2HN72_9BACT|nr:quinolinate synthase NadA [Sedimentisphaera cyanobacteriorum]AQQ08694.1 Quinolinate synthase A [Sedimentisphaera cyanobacteriorum]